MIIPMFLKIKYRRNIEKIISLDNVCVLIDEVMEEIDNGNCQYKDKFIENLKDMKFDIVAEMRQYENKNLDYMEFLEEYCYGRK